MSANDHQLFGAALQNRFDFFVEQVFRTLNPNEQYVPNWHVLAMCHALEKVNRGDVRRQIITVPPRNLKSITASVAFCAWVLGHNPRLRILVASYGHDLASKLSRDFRTIVEARWFQRAFPAFQIDSRKNAEGELMTTLRGGRKAVSVGGPVTGFGADILIVDDLLKANEIRSPSAREGANEYYEGTLFSRLDDKSTGRIIVVQQRLHENDLVGHLLEKGGFVHLNLPAIAARDDVFDLPQGRQHIRRKDDVLFPQREPREVLDDIRREMGLVNFSAQYQQDPTPPGGNHVKWEWFKTYDAVLPREAYSRVVQSWDTASQGGPENDFSVCMTFGYREAKWHLLEIVRRKIEYPRLRDLVVAQMQRWQADKVIVEHAGSGISLVAELHRTNPQIQYYQPRQSKEARLIAVSGLLSDGMIQVPRDAPWLDDLRRELLAFPNGKHDDQVDCLSQFLEWGRHPRNRAQNGRAQNGRTTPGIPKPQEISRRRRISLRERILAGYSKDVPYLG